MVIHIPAGAKGKYHEWLTEDGLKKLRGWARDGYSDVQLSKNMGISVGTYYEWVNKYPEFSEAIKKGRQPFIVDLEDALYRSGLGYDYEELVEEIYDEDGVQKKHLRRVKRHAPPNVTALIFALKNLRKQKFKDRPVDDTERADDLLLETLRRWDNAAKESGQSETT